MNLELVVRNKARRILPPSIRHPLGIFAGKLRSYILYPMLGLIFDLLGGKFRADGCSFIIPKSITSLAFRACFLMDNYEEDERRLVKKFILPEDNVLELGACLGVMACITNKLLRDPQKHVVVEANPYCIPFIHKNRARNHASFLIENCAVSNQSEVAFYINPTHITGSSLDVCSNHHVRLPGRSLSELNTRYGPFTVLIMDIEGAELKLLEASVTTLQSFRFILLELHESVIGEAGVSRCRQLLRQAGFGLVERSYISEAWVRERISSSPSAGPEVEVLPAVSQ